MASVFKFRFDEKSLAWSGLDYGYNEMLVKQLIQRAITLFKVHGYVYASDIFAPCISFNKELDKEAHKYHWDCELGHTLTIKTQPNSKKHYIDIICEGGTKK